MTSYRVKVGAILAGLVVLSGAIYLVAGIGGAYFAADDFQWLASGHTFTWSRVWRQIAGDHFYRPVVDLWFAAAVTGCRDLAACYHVANLVVHVLNVALVFAIAWGLFDDLRVAALGALLFAFDPGYAQAVVWVSAITGVLMTFFYLASLGAQIRSWTTANETRRVAYECVAVMMFGCALFTHEAAITLPVMSWMMWRLYGGRDWTIRPILLGGSILGVGTFTVLTLLANHRNAVFSENQYGIGFHLVQHGLDYFAALYVGPRWWPAYLLSAAAVTALLVTPRTSFGARWLLITLVPYLGFTAGNVSRYLYLPSIGFALAIAAALTVAYDHLAHRYARHARFAAIGFLLAATFIVARFARFNYSSIRGEIEMLEPWRAYAARLAREAPPATSGRVHLTPPPGGTVDAMYVGPMLQWVRQDYRLDVVVER